MFLKNNNSLIVKTNQLWKLKLTFGLIFVEFLILLLMVWNINNPNSKIFTVLGVGALQIQTIFFILGLLIFSSLFLLIKCPNCNKRLIYRIISTSGVNDWIYAIFNFQKCPFCGYTSDQRKT
jgi:hypothetical protein